MAKSDYRETIINYNEQDSIASVYTASRNVINRMDRLVSLNIATLHRDFGDAKEYHIDKSLIKITPKRKSNMTDEQKQAHADRLRAVRPKPTPTPQPTINSTV